MGRCYAQDTEVPVERSREELRRTLHAYGADEILDFSSRRQGVAAIQFSMKNRVLMLKVKLPKRGDFAYTGTGRDRSDTAVDAAMDKELRRRWRVLNLLVKAKLEAVADDDEAFDTEFAGYLVLPDGGTLGERLAPQLDALYDAAVLPPLVTGLLPPPKEANA